jgi:glycosyltransferase involved in cell wall biosynthesis
MDRLPNLSIFFPCYNDAGTIPTMVIRAVQAAREITDDFEIIVLDDGSHDDSVQVLEELKCAIPQLRIVEHDQPSGYGGNLCAGIEASTKEWVFYTDGDAQYDAREIELLVKALRPGVDVVNGWKIKRKDPLHRIIVGLAYQYFVKLIFGLKIRDVDCDFRLMRRSIFDVVQLESITGTVTFEMVKKIQDAGFIFAEVPVHHFYRQYGTSQFFNFPRVARTLVALIGWWWRLVIRQEGKQQAANRRLETADRKTQITGSPAKM